MVTKNAVFMRAVAFRKRLVLVENKRGGNDYKSVLEILNIYQAVGDMHFIGERDYFNKIEKKLEKELETDGGSL